MSFSEIKNAPRQDQVTQVTDQSVEVRELNDHAFEIELPGKMNELVGEGDPVESIKVALLLPETLPPEPESVRIVLSIHGQGASSELNADLFEALRASGAAVIAPTTSRRTAYNPETSGDFNAWMEGSFEGKGYPDETDDFRRGIESARKVLKEKIGDRQLELTLVGYSLGGTMATTLSETFDIKHLILVAPALSGLEKNAPLLAQPPQRDTLLSQAHAVENVTVIRGDQDPFIPLEDARAYTTDEAQLIEIQGAGHTFGALPFLPGDSENKRAELIEAITSSI